LTLNQLYTAGYTLTRRSLLTNGCEADALGAEVSRRAASTPPWVFDLPRGLCFLPGLALRWVAFWVYAEFGRQNCLGLDGFEQEVR